MGKTPLLVLHGALGSSKQMRPLVDILTNNFEVYSTNFSGHGGCEVPENLSIELFAHEISHFLDVNKIDHINIFGYSMGGYVALKLASMDGRIKSIFTLGTKFNWTPESAAHETKMLDPEKIELKVPAFANALKTRHMPEDWKKLMDKTSAMMRSLGQQPSIDPELLSSIEIPVIIGIGDQDVMVSLEESNWAVDYLPMGELITFKDFKHPIEQIDLEILADQIFKFSSMH